MPIDPSKVKWDAPAALDPASIKWDDGHSASYEQGRQAPGALQGLASVAQGPTFGFADEIGGALGGLYDTAVKGGKLSDNYKSNRDYLRGASDYQAEQNPITTLVTRGVAALPTAGLGVGSAALRSLGPTAGKLALGALNGGLFGAVQGAGNSTADTVSGIALDAAKGTGTGSLLGAAAPVAGMVAAPVGRNIWGRVSDSAAARYAKEKVAEAFVRDARGSAVQANSDAAIPQATARLDKLGSEARVVDAGGQNTRQLLDTLATLPGKTKDAAEAAIRARQASRGGRLADSAAQSMGVPSGQRLAPELESWAQQRAQAAQPLYDQVNQIRVQPDGDLIQMVAAADNLGASRIAQNIAEARMQPYTPATGQPQNGWSMRDLDNLKQGLDTLISQKVNRVDGGYTPEGASLIALKNQFVNKLDDMTGGAYAQARNAFAGPSALMDAARAGRAALARDESSIQQAMSGLQGSELDAFKLGAFESLRAKVGKEGGQTEILKMWKEPATQEKLKALFGDERAYRTFAADVAREARLKGLDSVGRGSQTAARHYGAGDLDVGALADAAGAVSGAGGISGTISALTKAWNKVQTPEAVRDAMGGLLLQQGQQGRQGLLGIQDAAKQISDKRFRSAAMLGVSGARASGLLNPLLFPQ